MRNLTNTHLNIRLQFKQGSSQEIESVRRVTGLVPMKQMMLLIMKLGLDANPRESRVSPIVKDIIDTLETDPDLYPLKSKGILLGTSQFEELDRLRFHLAFDADRKEGVLDGGHNLLGIGKYMLSRVSGDSKYQKAVKAIKRWADLKALLPAVEKEVLAFLETDDGFLEKVAQVELLLPKSSSLQDLDSFREILFDIKTARNNNASLPQSTLTNDAGLLDELKKQIGPELDIEWKANDGGSIKVTDIVALAWIPMMALGVTPLTEEGKPVTFPAPSQLYSSKGVCMEKFDSYMRSPGISKQYQETWSLTHPGVFSALKVAADFPALWDQVCEQLPDAYNAKDGRYGGLSAVASLNEKSRSPKSKYFGDELRLQSPEGYVMPFVYSLSALLEKDKDGLLYWVTDPFAFLDANMESLVERFITSLKQNDFDPQKVGKNNDVYLGLFDRVARYV